MPERALEARVFDIRYQCDGEARPGCTGTMRPTGRTLPGIQPNSMRFEHICVFCKDTKFLDKAYPTQFVIPRGADLPQWVIDSLMTEEEVASFNKPKLLT